jgi:hypothetical protein
MHFVCPLPDKTLFSIQEVLKSIMVSFPPHIWLHCVRLNNTKELDALVGKWILSMGSKCEPTPPYTSKYNGVTECFNQEVMTHVQCLLFDALLPDSWWAEAACYACNVINVTPTHVNPYLAAPFMLWHGHPLPSWHLHVFSTPGVMRLQSHERHKTSVQAIPVQFIGVVDYSTSTYRVYVPEQRRAVDTHNIAFDERGSVQAPIDSNTPTQLIYTPLLDDEDCSVDCFPVAAAEASGPPAAASSSAYGPTALSCGTAMGTDIVPPDLPDQPTVPPPNDATNTAVTDSSHTLDTPPPPGPPLIVGSSWGSVVVPSKQIDRAAASSAKHGGAVVATTHSGHNMWQPPHQADFKLVNRLHLLIAGAGPEASHAIHMALHMQQMNDTLAQHTVRIPRTLREVQMSKECDQWLNAMRQEYGVLVANDIFDLVPLPLG